MTTIIHGVGRILIERERQLWHEGFNAAHDDGHTGGELILAAKCYLDAALNPNEHWPSGSSPADWPWDWEDWKPSDDPIRNLEKAGALIAAEIDRLQRAQA